MQRVRALSLLSESKSSCWQFRDNNDYVSLVLTSTMSTKAQTRQYNPFLIICCCLVAALDGADTQALGIAVPLMARDLAFDISSVGLVLSVALAGAAIGAFFAGRLADRFGTKNVLICCVMLFGSLHFATAHVDGIHALLIMRFMAGLGLGGATPCFMAMAIGNVAPEHRSRIAGIVWAFFPAGALVGGLGNGWIVQNMTWREVFTVGGTVTIMVLIPLLFVRPQAQEHALREADSSVSIGPRKDRTIRNRLILLCLLYFAIFSTLAQMLWTPTLLLRGGFASGLGGVALAAHSLGALFSIAVGGFVFERIGGRSVTIGLFAGSALLVLYGLFISHFIITAAVVLLVGLFLGVAVAGAFALCSALLPEAMRSSALGIAMSVGRFGQMLIPYLTGLALSHNWSTAAAFSTAALIPFLIAFVGRHLDRLHRQQLPSITVK